MFFTEWFEIQRDFATPFKEMSPPELIINNNNNDNNNMQIYIPQLLRDPAALYNNDDY